MRPRSLHEPTTTQGSLTPSNRLTSYASAPGKVRSYRILERRFQPYRDTSGCPDHPGDCRPALPPDSLRPTWPHFRPPLALFGSAVASAYLSLRLLGGTRVPGWHPDGRLRR